MPTYAYVTVNRRYRTLIGQHLATDGATEKWRNTLIGCQVAANVVGTLHTAVATGNAAARHLGENPLRRIKLANYKKRYF
jgi:hypothetical protein